MRKAQGVGLDKQHGRAVRLLSYFAAITLFFGMFAGNLAAQTVTGQVSGTVSDPSGAVVLGAKVDLVNTLTQQTRSVTTNTSGDFLFTDVVPGTYDIHIAMTGFETYNQTNIVLGTREILALHQIQLAVGNVTTEVTVQATAARVETDSSAHTGLVTDAQISEIPNKGRNFKDYLRVLPGTTGGGMTDAPGWGSGGVQFNGGDNGVVLLQLDGIASQDTGAPGGLSSYITPSVDAIQEMRVQAGNQNAEFGARGGGTVNVTVKSGTSRFHGDVYEFNRNNFYNANDYFRKDKPTPAISGHPAPYKFNDWGGTIGGPILLPFTQYNRDRTKAFFFFSSEYLHRTNSGTPSNVTMPTPDERNGIFTNLTSNLVDPSGTAPTCSGIKPTITCTFPASDFNAAGQEFLKLLPLPTCLRDGVDSPANNYGGSPSSLPSCGPKVTNFNYNYVNTYPWPWYDDILRADFNLGEKETFFVRLIKNYENREGQSGFLGGSGAWPQSLIFYTIHSVGAVSTLVSTLRPNLVNEFTAGINSALQTTTPFNQAAIDNNNRVKLGLGPSVLPVLFPDPKNGGAQALTANPRDLIPNVSFGGGIAESYASNLPSSPSFSFESRYPFFGTDRDWTVTDNLSWVKGTHALKFGIFFEHVSRSTARASAFNGSYSFNQDTTNPLDTTNTFANALTGVFQSYGEANYHPFAHGLNKDIEWFAQDTWKVTRRLTVDYGMRFSILFPDSLRNQTLSEFNPSAYNAADQPRLIQPFCANGVSPCKGANRVGYDPITGAKYPSATIGLFVPNTGQPYQGMSEYVSNSFNTPPLGYGPRFGFAWDIFGNGKTAMRGGFGMFYDRPGSIDDIALSLVEQPPLISTPTIFNATIGGFLATPPTQLFIGPQSVNGKQRDYVMPQAYDYNLGIQRDLTHGALLDVSYVGNVARHFAGNTNLSALPFGADFTAAGTDPTTNSPYPNAIIACNLNLYCGYSGTTFETFDRNSNYNSLQINLTKRFGRSLTAGGAFTYSKVLDYGGCCSIWLPKNFYYGPGSQDRRKTLDLNWTYNLPSTHMENIIAKRMLNGWVVQGIGEFVTGSPQTVSASYPASNPNGGGPFTGLIVTGTPVLPGGQRTPVAGFGPQYLNPSAFGPAPNGPGVCQFQQPATCALGNNSPRAVFYGPGVNNWNVSVFKNFPLGKNEARHIQFRAETYNTFNHTQFTSVSTGANFKGPGGTTLGSPQLPFGQFTGAAPARIMALAIKVYF